MKGHYGHQVVSTKANTLYALSKVITKSKIEKMYILPVAEYLRDKNAIISDIAGRFGGDMIVVRSSSSKEDSFKASNAGHYKSVLGIDSGDALQVADAVEQVIRSYRKDGENIENEQVLIQRQARDVRYSGVVFTRDIQGNRPYYLINYDDQGSTDSVTSGQGGKTLWILKNADFSSFEEPWGSLVTAVQEIELFLNGMALDMEFAVNMRGEVIIFQVRPLVASYKHGKEIDDWEFFERCDSIRSRYRRDVSVLNGKTMMLSDMAFWNPSEIIGTNPRELEYSLYQEIITKNAWNKGIAEIGYRRLDEKLMYRLGNKPYISLEYSFYSLIPQSVDEGLARRLVDFYCDRLRGDVTAHDKIEFEIAYTSYDFCTESHSRRLLERGFSEEERRELLDALFGLTSGCVLNYDKILEEDLLSLKLLNNVREPIEQALEYKGLSAAEMLKSVLKLIEALLRHGTPQFTRQARLAFMARSFCRTLVEAGYFTDEEMDAFMKSINTVSSQFDRDFERFSDGRLSRDEFNAKYGHLRSGTYDIRTDRYDRMSFRPLSGRRHGAQDGKSASLERERLERALESINLKIGAADFERFLRSAMEQREYFKFEFTKSLSLALELLIGAGEELDIKRRELSWLRIGDIEEWVRSGAQQYKEKLSELFEERREEYILNRMVILPEVITSERDMDIIPVSEARPNFITSKRVEGEVIVLEEEPEADLTDKIVAIPKADPGYEWIFTKGIKGFITRYGGVASHMAIRCAEFDIPAAIGCGEKIYGYVTGMSYIDLDCRNGRIEEGLQYKNLRALITQREGVNQYGDPTDILEAAYIRFYELLGFIPAPVSNHTKNFELLFERPVDLLIVVGGGSLNPIYYDREHDDELQPHRDATEEKLIKYCVAHKIPIIATCRGMQYLNVLYGGKLAYHPKLKVKRARGEDHKVYLVKENRTINVNNYHKDCIFEGSLAPCFTPIAVDTENGVIEAYESEEMKILGIQWHPERRFATANSQEETRKLVLDFIRKYVAK
ncbi:MAG: gamma-glutamyl-gamma-aminobutyrate hydrolase family protein [Butyrivibrio sp.]|nr:gamma-glutamyl-gamma-aminobutyrate hydrolase family protein [Butyrivibrio sp.]